MVINIDIPIVNDGNTCLRHRDGASTVVSRSYGALTLLDTLVYNHPVMSFGYQH